MGLFNLFNRKAKTGVADENVPDDFPLFKYHKNSLKTKAFIKSAEICPCCKQKRGYAYFGPIYSAESDEENFCPWCIDDGSAAKKFNGEFVPEPMDTEGIPQDFKEELIYRTPCMETWQDIEWPAHCGDFCEFIDYAAWRDIKKLGIEDEIAADIEDQGEFEVSEVKKNLSKDDCMRGYLFRCLKCGKHILHIDLD